VPVKNVGDVNLVAREALFDDECGRARRLERMGRKEANVR